QAIQDAQKEAFYSKSPGSPTYSSSAGVGNKNDSGTGGTGGTGGSGGGGSSGKKTSSSGSGGYSYSGGSLVTSAIPAPAPTPIEPDTTVQDSYKAAMEAANDRLKQAYEYQQKQLGTARDNALREAYIKQQMVERRYPEQLSAAGINGGAAQGLLARNNADYANQRTSIQGNYLNNLGEAGFTYQQGIAQNNEDFLNRMAAYQQSLDEMRRKWELEQLEKSGLLGVNPYAYSSYGTGSVQPISAQAYLNNLRNTYGNLFK
ncbi:MAG: hypothetical protein J6S23_01745, partial [Clostridia bacterium]|nr:hypothetical protein [Clostridia bacterium]